MPIRVAPMRRLAVALASALLAHTAAANPELPRPPQLEPNVRFWTRVYTEVDTGGGLIHDSEHLDVVYEVVRVPAGLSNRAREQRIDAVKDRYRAILRKLARGERTGLSEEERRVLALWPEGTSDASFERATGDLRFQLGQADKFRAGLSRSALWADHIAQALEQQGVPRELVALPHVESSFNPRAYSRVGAAGLWQFTRSTGRRYMRVDEVVDERMDPHQATVGAARLLRDNYRRLQSWPLAITAYNHGASGMERAVRQLGTRDIGVIAHQYQSGIFGFASRNFYTEFLAASQIHQDPERYFGKIDPEPSVDYEILVTDHFYRAPSLVRVLGVDLDVLREHNLALRPAVWNGAKYVPKGYALRIPRSELRQPLAVALGRIPHDEQHSEQPRDRFYKVRRGETLSVIAHRYGVRESELVAVNSLRSRHQIGVGQVLRLPQDVTLPAEPVVVASAAPEPVAAHTPPAPAREPAAAPQTPPAPEVAAAEPTRAPEPEATPEPTRAPEPAATPEIVVAAAKPAEAVAPPAPPAAPPRVAPRPPAHESQLPDAAREIAPAIASGAQTEASAIPATYQVRRGDTLSRIAARFGLSERELVALNGLPSRHRIATGQQLRVGRPSSAAAPPSSHAPPPEPVVASARAAETHVAAPTQPDAAAEGIRDEPAVAAGAEEVEIEAGQEPEEADVRPAAAVVSEPAPAPGSATPRPPAPDPSNYSVTPDQRITVQAEETIGHYAEWLGVSAGQLRRINGMRPGTPLVIGRQRKLDFSRVTPEVFEQRRLEYHQALQEEFFDAFEVTGTAQHVLRKGETLWYLARRQYEVPMWLLVQYNPDLDFGSLSPGTPLVIPVLEARDRG